MLKHSKTTETDQIFDQIIYNETYPTVPIKNYFLYSTVPYSDLKNDRRTNTNYISPFRSHLTQDQIEWLQDLKYERHSHKIHYPEYLNVLDDLQLKELNDIKLKEKKLEYYKKSQEVTKFDEPNYKYNNKPIHLNSVPKVPTFTYQKKQTTPSSAFPSLDNPWATPENKESIIIYNNKFYSKPIFDNIQLEKLKNKQYIDNQWKLCQNTKNNQLQQEYEPKFNELDKSIDLVNQKLISLKEKIDRLDKYYENDLTKKIFINVASYNKKKNNKLSHLFTLRRVLSQPPFVQQIYQNDHNPDYADSFEYETSEEIKYVQN